MDWALYKAHVDACGLFCGARRLPNFWAFLRSFARRRLKNWISVGDWITGFFHACTPYTM